MSEWTPGMTIAPVSLAHQKLMSVQLECRTDLAKPKSHNLRFNYCTVHNTVHEDLEYYYDQDVWQKIARIYSERLLFTSSAVERRRRRRKKSPQNPQWQVTRHGRTTSLLKQKSWNAMETPKFSDSRKIPSVSVCWKSYGLCILGCRRSHPWWVHA